MQKFGIMIMSGFAAIWCAWGLSTLRPLPVELLIIPVAITGVFLALAWRMPVRADAAERSRTGRMIGWASGLEGAAILVANNVLLWTGYPAYGVCATAAIVGLHFLPLAYLMRVRRYYATGAALVALGAASCAIPDDDRRLLVVGVGAALLLWTTCLTLVAAPRGSEPEGSSRGRIGKGAALQGM